MRNIITLKNLSSPKKLGGVGFFFLAIKPYLSPETTYFHFSDDNSSNFLIKTFFRLNDLVRFIWICGFREKNNTITHLNPSLSWSSLFRDGLFLIIAKLSKKKIVVFFRGWHNYMVYLIDNKRLGKLLFKWVFGKADAIIVLSVKFQQKLEEWDFKKPIYIETTVVDEALISDNEEINSNKDNKSINILFLARVETYKGIFELIDAFEILKIKHPNISLTITGDGSKLSDAKKIIKEKGIKDVCFTGYVINMAKAKVYSSSDIYALPSYGEGMPNSVLEAMAFGLPVISRPVGGLNDFFINGKMGYLTESKDPKVLAELIEKLIVNPKLRREISAHNSAFARKHFMASTVAKRLENIYKEVLEGTAKGGSWTDCQYDC